MANTTVTPTGSGVTVTFTATDGDAAAARSAERHGSRRSGATQSPASSPVTIPYASFNTMCWDTAAVGAAAYAKQPITNFELVVPGGATATTGVSVMLTTSGRIYSIPR